MDEAPPVLPLPQPPVPLGPAPVDPNAPNPFGNAAPAIPVAPNAPPGGGVQEIGEFGPYYIYQGDTVVELPAVNVVRDYDYAYKCTEQDLRSLIDDGWCNAFESSAILHQRPLKSRSIVVLSNNGWMSGAPTEYHWCIRVDVVVEQVDGCPAGRFPEETVSQDPKELLHFGRHVLWPIAPQRAINARDHWKSDETLRNSRLVEVYVPSAKAFDYSKVEHHTICEHVEVSTLRLLQNFKSVPEQRLTHVTVPSTRLATFDLAEPTDEARNTLFASKIVSSGMRARAARCMSELRFTASDATGWNALEEDTQLYIWEMLANQALNTHGGCESPSLAMWLSLRRICKQSKATVERLTKMLMKSSCNQWLRTRESRAIADAIALRDILVPRGINAHALRLEIYHKESRFVVDAVYSSVIPYMRLRSGKVPTETVVFELSVCESPKPIEHIEEPAAASSSRTFQRRPAQMSVPRDKPQRSSKRVAIQKSTKEFQASHALVSHTETPTPSAMSRTWQNITFKLGIPPDVEMEDLSTAVVVSKPPSPPKKKAKVVTSWAQTVQQIRERARAPHLPRVLEGPIKANPCKATKTELGSWVQCEACEKWRRLEAAPGLGDYLSVQYLPKHWYCDMHPSGITCDDCEDEMDEGEVTKNEFGDSDELASKSVASTSRNIGPLRSGLRRRM